MDQIISILKFSIYPFEIILLELTLLYSFPKKKNFYLKYILATLVMLVAFGLMAYGISLFKQAALQMITSFVILAVSIAVYYFVFDSSIWSIAVAAIGAVAVQHIGYHLSCITNILFNIPSEFITLSELSYCLALAVVSFLTLGKIIKKNRIFLSDYKPLIIISIITLIICWGIMRFYRIGEKVDNIYVSIGFSIYAITCCSLVLVIQFFFYSYFNVKKENQMQKRIMIEEKKQFKLAKENNEELNIKYHDLKNIVSDLKNKVPEDELTNIESSLLTYSSTFKTGFDVLDIILTEKAKECNRKQIKFTFMGDGNSISFMKVMDVYSLFNNAISNGIESCEKIENITKREITIVMKKVGDYIYVNFKNYFVQQPLIESNTLLTTKTNELGSHGFGVKSIKRIAESYNGGLTFKAENEIFDLNVYLESNAK